MSFALFFYYLKHSSKLFIPAVSTIIASFFAGWGHSSFTISLAPMNFLTVFK